MELTPRKQPNTCPTRFAAASLWLVTMLILLTACTRSASTSPTLITTESTPSITVDQVQVTQGTGINISGSGVVPAGDCVKTELLQNGEPVAWWPEDICVEVGAGRWEMLAALGREGAPAQLDTTAQYEIRARARSNPDATSVRFPFDLEGPPQP